MPSFTLSQVVTRCAATVAGLALGIAALGMSHSMDGSALPFASTVTSAVASTPAYAADKDTTQSSRILTLKDSTRIVTADSGYFAEFTVTNTSDADVSAGTLTLLTSPRFEFQTADAMQKWADGDIFIRSLSLFAQADVPALKAGKSATVRVHLDVSDPALAALTTWGARPLLARYQSNDDALTHSIHTFLTRSNAGTNSESLPALNVVFTVPVSEGNIAACVTNSDTSQNAQDSMSNLLSGTSLGSSENSSENSSANSSSQSSSNDNSQDSHTNSNSGSNSDATSSTTSGSANSSDSSHESSHSSETCYASAVSRLAKIKQDNPNVEILADPQLMSALNNEQSSESSSSSNASSLSVSHTIQPFAMDISSLANSEHTSSLSAAQASSVSTSSVAIDGLSGWSQNALKTAQSLGYSTVIATQGFSSSSDSAVHNSVAQTTINGSRMTVLPAQNELSTLAQGQASSDKAEDDAENTSAALLNRFIAQTAFYETQAPYEQRTILVNAASVSSDLSTQRLSFISSLTNVLSSAPWTNLSNLDSLVSAQSPYTSAEVDEFIADAAKLSKGNTQAILEIVTQIENNKSRITSFLGSVVDSAQSPSSSKDSRNPQDLARGKADQSRALSSDELQTWQKSLTTFTENFASSSLSGLSITTYARNPQKLSSLKAYSAVTQQLLNSVNISVPQSLHVVSETATVPVTLSNNLPVSLKVNVATMSSEKVRSEVTIDGMKDITLAAHSEQQITLPVRAISGWTTTFQIYLTTAEGTIINTKKSITVSSSFTIMDNAGYAIFGLAILLAVLGIKRQISRGRSAESSEDSGEPADTSHASDASDAASGTSNAMSDATSEATSDTASDFSSNISDDISASSTSPQE